MARFDTCAAAVKYSRALNGTATHRREMRCILQGLREVKSGAAILDLPCGTGRLLPELSAKGIRVTSADSSPHMVELARKYATDCSLKIDPGLFIVASVFDMPFADGQFDAVVCNRLLHHFREPAVRQNALRELRRVSRGPVVVSFFCNSSFDGVVFHVKDALRSNKASDRIPIPKRVFENDVRAAGLRITQWLPTRPGLSKQWYAVMAKA